LTLNVASPEAEVRSRIVSSVQVSSPDGRKWVVSTARTHRSWKESRQTAFFWAHVVVTAIMVVLFVVVFRADWSRILELLIPLVLALWLFGFVSSSFHVTVAADTLGPPVDHRLWTVTKRFRRGSSVQKLTESIQAGDLTPEPVGTRLDEI
jgi:hypothetical protein